MSSYQFYEDNYPMMIQDPWDGIVDMPAFMWIQQGLSPDNYMVQSNHDIFTLLHTMGHFSDEMYNGTKDPVQWVIMTKECVNKFIHDFQKAMKETK